MAAAKQLFKHLVKLPADLLKLLLKLPPHAGVQLFNDAHQSLFRLHQILMLGPHKLIPLRDLLVVLNGVDVHIAQGPDGLLKGPGLPLHLPQRRPLGIEKCLGRGCGQLILAPHVLHMALQPLVQFLLLALKPEQFFVQMVHAPGKLLPLIKQPLLLPGLLLPGPGKPKALLLQALRLLGQFFNLLLDLLDLLHPLANGLAAGAGAAFQLGKLLIKLVHLSPDTPDIFLDKLVFLLQIGAGKLHGGQILCQLLPPLFFLLQLPRQSLDLLLLLKILRLQPLDSV